MFFNMRLVLGLSFIFLLQLNIIAQTPFCDSLLTKKERIWLKENKDSIKYAPNPFWPPGDYVDSEGKHQGIVSDYIKIFEKKLGLKFKRVYYDDWNQILDGLKSSEVDFVGAIQQTDNRSQYLDFTSVFMDVPLVILTRTDNHHELTDEYINSMKIACVEGYIVKDIICQQYPDAKVIENSDDLTAVLQTSFGSTDGTVVDLMIASYVVHNYGITNLKLAGELGFIWNLRFACQKGKPELTSILDKLLNTIDEEQRRKIYNKWVAIGSIHKKSFLEKNLPLILIITGVLFFLLLFFLIINRTLRQLVKMHTKELVTAKEKAEESSRLKTAFLANLSHEIRTPMNAIIGFSTLLKQTDLTYEERDNFINMVHNSGYHLLSIIEDIVEVSKLDTGQVLVSRNEFDINNFSRVVYESMLVEIPKEKNVEFVMEKSNIPENTIISTDEVKLKQVVSNLITNAFKYSLKGTVFYRYNIRQNNTLEIIVEDNGIGIPKKYQEVIFERFRQVDSGEKIPQSGSGLGLSISKAYVEMLGGSISVDSEEDKGSKFTVSIPL